MKTSDFDFFLPEHLIAQNPPEKRGESRLLTLDRSQGKRTHRMVKDLPEILNALNFLSPQGEKPLLVFNDTKVRKARIKGVSKDSGAEAEFLLLEKNENGEWKTLVNRAKRRKTGSRYIFYDENKNEIALAEITDEQNEFRYLKFDRIVGDEFLDRYGHIPLPPYIKRDDVPQDAQRYQTIYAKQTGSAAAPTAGLHFTREIMNAFNDCGIETAFVTLHVGLGTFLPVRSERVEDHVMHEENFYIDEITAAKIENAKKNGRKIIAVGTTSVRTLESACFFEGEDVSGSLKNIKIKAGESKTSIFIYPGYQFKIVDAVFTNFHTPESTLLMLVSAFAGREFILESYAEAIREEYRFFSYGDAMLIY